MWHFNYVYVYAFKFPFYRNVNAQTANVALTRRNSTDRFCVKNERAAGSGWPSRPRNSRLQQRRCSSDSGNGASGNGAARRGLSDHAVGWNLSRQSTLHWSSLCCFPEMSFQWLADCIIARCQRLLPNNFVYYIHCRRYLRRLWALGPTLVVLFKGAFNFASINKVTISKAWRLVYTEMVAWDI